MSLLILLTNIIHNDKIFTVKLLTKKLYKHKNEMLIKDVNNFIILKCLLCLNQTTGMLGPANV